MTTIEQQNERKTSDELKQEIAKLFALLEEADSERDQQLAQKAALEAHRDELLTELDLGGKVKRELDKTLAQLEALNNLPDPKQRLRRAIGEREARYRRVRKRERALDAAVIAEGLLGEAREAERKIMEAASDLQLIMRRLTDCYAAAMDSKTIGPSQTARRIVYESIKRAFSALLDPLMERPRTSEDRPLELWLETIIARGRR